MGEYSNKGDFKKGNTLGTGRPKLPDEFKSLNKMPKDIYERIIAKYLLMDFSELERIATQEIKTLPVIEAYVVAIIAEGMRSKNHQIMEWLATRSVGRVKDDLTLEETEAEGHKQLVEFFRNRKKALESKNE